MKNIFNRFQNNYNRMVFQNSVITQTNDAWKEEIKDKVNVKLNKNEVEDKKYEEKIISNMENILASLPNKKGLSEELNKVVKKSLENTQDVETLNEFNKFEQNLNSLIKTDILSTFTTSEKAILSMNKSADGEYEKTGVFTKTEEPYTPEEKNIIMTKLKVVGLLPGSGKFEDIDRGMVQQVLIDAGYLKESDPMALDGVFGKVTIGALDKFYDDMKKVAEKQKKHTENLKKLENETDLTKWEVTPELQFNPTEELFDGENIKSDATILDLQNANSEASMDMETFSAEMQATSNSYTSLQNEINEIRTPKSTLGKTGRFLSSLFKTAIWPATIALSFTDDNEEVKALKKKKENLKRMLVRRKATLLAKKEKIAQNSAKLKKAGDLMLSKKQKERSEYLSASEQNQNAGETAKKRNEAKYNELLAQKKLLSDYKLKLDEKRKSITDNKEKFEYALSKGNEEKTLLDINKDKISGAITTLESSLTKIPKNSLQYKKILEQIDKLKGKEKLLNDYKKASEGNIAGLESKLIDTNGQEIDLYWNLDSVDGQLGIMESTALSLEEAIKQTDIVMRRNGTQVERISANFDQNEAVLAYLDAQIDASVDKNMQAIEQQSSSVQSLNVDDLDSPRMSFWEESVGGVMKGVSQFVKGAVVPALTAIPKEVSWIGTKIEDWNIPVISPWIGGGLDFVGDTVTGVVEGAGELVSGIATMIEHPVEAAKGLGALIGRNPATGEFGLDTFTETWKMFGLSILGFSDVDRDGDLEWGEEGNRGIALGRGIANIASFFIPGSGAGKAGRLAANTSLKAARLAEKSSKVAKLASMGIKSIAYARGATGAVLINMAKRGPAVVKGIAKAPFTVPIELAKSIYRGGLKVANPAKYYEGVVTRLENAISKTGKPMANLDKFMDKAGKIDFSKIGPNEAGRQARLIFKESIKRKKLNNLTNKLTKANKKLGGITLKANQAEYAKTTKNIMKSVEKEVKKSAKTPEALSITDINESILRDDLFDKISELTPKEIAKGIKYLEQELKKDPTITRYSDNLEMLKNSRNALDKVRGVLPKMPKIIDWSKVINFGKAMYEKPQEWLANSKTYLQGLITKDGAKAFMNGYLKYSGMKTAWKAVIENIQFPNDVTTMTVVVGLINENLNKAIEEGKIPESDRDAFWRQFGKDLEKQAKLELRQETLV